MERKINEQFEQDEQMYVVQLAGEKKGCRKCDLYNKKYGCTGDLDVTGDCLASFREDGQNVYFKKVKP